MVMLLCHFHFCSICRYVSQSAASQKHRPIYTHLTTATDTQLIERVFHNVAEIILNDILRQIGLH